MCGISGIFSFKKDLSERKILISKMLEKISHRGPDDSGEFHDEFVSLGFVRLSIIDLTSSGHQPFHSQDNRYCIIFNGEIFNFIELRDELIDLGRIFLTNSDTEVLLNAYLEWGEDCQHKFNGMWAFTIYDKHENNLFISRDRYGIKPLYYYFNDDELFFASEIKALLITKHERSKPNKLAIFDYLAHNRTDYDHTTFFQGIFKVEQGQSLHISVKNGKLQIQKKKWYILEDHINKSNGFSQIDEFKELFEDAMKIRMRSDVPVGICLSGGLDSSSIASVILDQKMSEKLETFSAVFDDTFAKNEKKYISLFVNKKISQNFVKPEGEELLNQLDSFFELHTEPMPSTSIFAGLMVMKSAKNKVKVILDGQGADEILGGYHYLIGYYFKDLFFKFKFFKLIKEIINSTRKLKSNEAMFSFFFSILPNKQKTLMRIKKYGGYLDNSYIEDNASNSLIAKKLYDVKNFNDVLSAHIKYKLEHLLKWEDINSMSQSIEARVPFLDHRIVEKAIASNVEMLYNNGATKYILRESMKGILPEEIRVRHDKIGFETPQDQWFRDNSWKNLITNIINSEKFKNRKIFNVSKVKQLYSDHLENKINIGNEIWKWISLELWYRRYID